MGIRQLVAIENQSEGITYIGYQPIEGVIRQCITVPTNDLSSGNYTEKARLFWYDAENRGRETITIKGLSNLITSNIGTVEVVSAGCD